LFGAHHYCMKCNSRSFSPFWWVCSRCLEEWRRVMMKDDAAELLKNGQQWWTGPWPDRTEDGRLRREAYGLPWGFFEAILVEENAGFCARGWSSYVDKRADLFFGSRRREIEFFLGVVEEKEGILMRTKWKKYL
jgi:hypothetical protein